MQPGIYKTSWSLVDEGRGTFGPHMWLTYDVVACDTDAGLVTPDGGPAPHGDGDAGDGGSADTSGGSGGCSTAPGRAGSSGFVLAALALLLVRRRQGASVRA
jgi:MYXO-CTERM domain-containing protein